MFTEFKYSHAQVSEAVAEIAAALRKSNPDADAARFAASIIAKRLYEEPGAYLSYGPYGWAVKAALAELGEDFGAEDDRLVGSEYVGRFFACAALVAGEHFRDYYSTHFLEGARRFDLDTGDGDPDQLFDPDMESWRGGGSPRTVLDADSRSEQGGEVLLGAPGSIDLARMVPHRVEFAHGLGLWTGDVYALDSVGASAKESTLEGSVGLATAFERAGEPAMDSADGAAFYVDFDARPELLARAA